MRRSVVARLRRRTLVMMPVACALLSGCAWNMFQMSVWHEEPKITELTQTGDFSFGDDLMTSPEGTYEVNFLEVRPDGSPAWVPQGAINIEIAGSGVKSKKGTVFAGVQLRRYNGWLTADATLIQEFPTEDTATVPIEIHIEQTDVMPFVGGMIREEALYARGIMGFRVADVPVFDPEAATEEELFFMETALGLTILGEAGLAIPLGKSGFEVRLGVEAGVEVPPGYIYGYGWKIAYREGGMTIMIGKRLRVWGTTSHLDSDYDEDYKLVTESEGLFVSATLRF